MKCCKYLLFLQPESPAHVFASLLVPPVNPEIEVIEPVKMLRIKVAKPKTSFLQGEKHISGGARENCNGPTSQVVLALERSLRC